MKTGTNERDAKKPIGTIGVKISTAAPKTCRGCKITKLCDGFEKCVWPVYAAGIKLAQSSLPKTTTPCSNCGSKREPISTGEMCPDCYC